MRSGAIALVLATAVVWMWACNERIMSADTPKIVRLLVTAFFPPRDLYEFLVRHELDISKQNVMVLDFEAKYRGRYEVGILLKKFNSDKLYGTQYISPLKLRLTFIRGSTPIWSESIGKFYSPFIGKEASGFGFVSIDVPRDIPIGELVTCRIEIVLPDAALSSLYGPSEFFIRKISEK